MAGGVYKGLTIQLDGKTTQLEAAMRRLETAGSKLDKEMRQVKKSLDLDPSSPQAYARQMELLSQGVENAKKKLEALKDAEDRASRGEQKMSTDQWTKLQYDIKQAEGELRSYNRQMQDLAAKHAAADSALGRTGQKLDELGQKTKDVGDKLQDIGGKLTAAFTATEAAAAVASVKAAVGFETSLAKVSTLVDTSVVDMEKMGDGAKELAKQYGMSASDINEALYQSISASVDAGDAVEFVGKATKLAKAGFTDSATAVDTLTTAINAYGMSADDATHISDVLVNTQNLGKTTVNELGASMGQVIPSAAAYGVSLENLASAYVSMTKQGINTANATTYINGMFTELANSGSDVAAILQEKTGKSFGQLMNDGMSLGDVLSVIYESVDYDSEAFANLWGNVRAGKGALALANGGAEEFNKTLESMVDATGIVDTAFGKVSETTEEQFNRMKAQVEDAAISVGQALLPTVQEIIGAVKDAAEAFNAMDESERKNVIATAAFVAGLGPAIKLLGMLMSNVSKVGKGMMSFAQLLARIDVATSGAATGFKKTADAAGSMTTSLKPASVAMGALKAGAAAAAVAGVALLVSAIKDYLKKADDYQKATTGLVEKTKKLASVSDVLSDKAGAQASSAKIAANAWKDYGKAAADAAEKGKEFGESMDSAFSDAAVDAGLVQAYVDKIKDLAGNVDGSSYKLAQLEDMVGKYNELTGDAVEITDDYTGALSASTSELQANADAFKANAYAKAASELAAESAKREIELKLEIDEVNQKIIEDQQRYNELMEEAASADSPFESRAALDAAEALSGEIEKEKKASESLTAQLEAQEQTTEALISKQAEYASGVEGVKEEVEELADTEVPDKEFEVEAKADEAESTLDRIISKLLGIKDKDVTITTRLETVGSAASAGMGLGFARGGISQVPLSEIPRHADGGISGIATRATLTNIGWVGEAGAEAIIPLTNKRYVAPFAQAVASQINGGDTNSYSYSITINARGDGDDIASSVTRAIRAEELMRGRRK